MGLIRYNLCLSIFSYIWGLMHSPQGALFRPPDERIFISYARTKTILHNYLVRIEASKEEEEKSTNFSMYLVNPTIKTIAGPGLKPIKNTFNFTYNLDFGVQVRD